ncbi:hypothetical protein R6Q59_036073 [Mikania micrantha]
MKQKIPLITKNVWNLIFFMLNKSISKTKLMLDLNIMMKHIKINSREYEFSCSNNPNTTSKKHQNKRNHLANPSPTLAGDDRDDIAIDPTAIKFFINKSPMVKQLTD